MKYLGIKITKLVFHQTYHLLALSDGKWFCIFFGVPACVKSSLYVPIDVLNVLGLDMVKKDVYNYLAHLKLLIIFRCYIVIMKFIHYQLAKIQYCLLKIFCLHDLNLCLIRLRFNKLLIEFPVIFEVRFYYKPETVFLICHQSHAFVVANVLQCLAKYAVAHEFEEILFKPVGCFFAQSCTQDNISLDSYTLLKLDYSITFLSSCFSA